MLSINTNNASMAAVNAISKSSSSLSTSMERPATGNRINSSADDAAGKQIANRLTAQSSGMGVALSNINDATAMLQTADSMFDEMSDVLGRMKDLSTQAANGTYSDDDLRRRCRTNTTNWVSRCLTCCKTPPITAAPTCSVFPAPATPVLTVCSRAR